MIGNHHWIVQASYEAMQFEPMQRRHDTYRRSSNDFTFLRSEQPQDDRSRLPRPQDGKSAA